MEGGVLMNITSIIFIIVSFLAAPILPGLINKTKALFGGRQGPRVLQLYYDIFKLARKTPTYSKTASALTRIAPVAIAVSTLAALTLVPSFFNNSAIHFTGDIILMAYLLGLGRFFMVTAALDRGSAFEGMGASREVLYSALAEPSFFAGLLIMIHETGSLELSEIFSKLSLNFWQENPAILFLILCSWFVILLVENARIPIDDPNTHLELTMIHEVMILDYGAKDLALIEYASALKLWIYSALIVGMVINGEIITNLTMQIAIFTLGMAIVAFVIGTIESITARIKLVFIPKFIVGSGALAIIALILKVAGN